jgi:mRNA interferase MazF
MVNQSYVPEQGDVVWLDFSPQAGHEQAGRRPAFAVSPSAYNGRVGLALFCPVTTQVKGYPFEVGIPVGQPISGVILSDHVKSLDWRARHAVQICSLSSATIAEVLRKLKTLL